MTYITKLNSFDEVKAWYEKTPVLKSNRHPVEQDIRPIGNRSRKWERIIKITENCYVLSCGGSVDPVFCWGWSGTKLQEFPITPKETATLSPIVWRKHKDGSETVTIRNGQGDWQHNSLYSFLSRALPRELWFRINRKGRQAIYNRSEGKEYYLPKTKTTPRHRYEHLKSEAQTHDWAKKHLRNCMVHFDDMSLTFRRTKEGKFELAGEAPKEMVKLNRVDLTGKKKFKPHIDEVFTWAMTMYPLMRDQLTYNFRSETNKRLVDIAKEHNIKHWTPSWSALFLRSDADLIREILINPQHPMRYEFGIAAMFEIHEIVQNMDRNRENGWDHAGLTDEEFEKLKRNKVRAAYTRWINKMANFNKTVTKEK